MKARLLWFVCLLTAAGLILTSAQDVKYIQLGGTLELGPDITSVTAPITGVLWKHGPNKVAEWDKGFGFPDEDYYGTFRSRTRLDKENGKLVVNNMSTNDTGEYSVEVNGRVQNKKYPVVVIKDVPKPEVVVKPLSCSPASNDCTLVCEGDVKDRGPDTYRWKKDEEWMELDSTQTPAQFQITKAKEGKAKTFSCVMKNPFSEMQSEPIPNPLYEGDPPPPPYWIFAVVIVIVGIVALLVGLVKLNEPMRKKFEPLQSILPKCLNDWLGFPGATKEETKEENEPMNDGDPETATTGPAPEDRNGGATKEETKEENATTGPAPEDRNGGDKLDVVKEVKKEDSSDSQPSAATSDKNVGSQ